MYMNLTAEGCFHLSWGKQGLHTLPGCFLHTPFNATLRGLNSKPTSLSELLRTLLATAQ